jgi:hypothetical protein
MSGPLSVRQIGNEIEIRRGHKLRRLPLSFLNGMAAEISDCAEATVMSWHCISAVEALLVAIEMDGLSIVL